MPFLVDTVTMALAEQGIGVHVLGHPVVTFQRDKAGKLLAVGDGTPESLMHLEIDRQSANAMAKIGKAIEAALADVRAIVRDWSRCAIACCRSRTSWSPASSRWTSMRADESQEFLRWAADNHFTFLGYREYEVVKQGDDEVLRGVDGSGLGLMRGHDSGKPRSVKSLPAHSVSKKSGAETLILTKTNARSTVHRPGYMDYIGVLEFDAKGKAGARAAFPRPVYLQRVQPSPVGHPAGAPAPRLRDAQVRPCAQQPQRQGVAPHPGNAAARRAVPVHRRRAAAHQHRHPRPAGARAQQAVPAPRPLRSLLLRPGLHPARSLQHRRPPAHRSDAEADAAR